MSYSGYFKNKKFLATLALALGMLGASLVINFYAGQYATASESNAVTDIILDNVPAFDVDGIFVFGALALVGLISVLCIARPRWTPFLVKSVSVFVVTRSLFVTLTHLAPVSTRTSIDVFNAISKFTFGGDLFFSGHTGLPFLMALIFWDSKPLRWLFLCTSIFFAATVLLGHLHYSIDVFAAFFITYGTFRLSQLFFVDDVHLFKNGLPEEA